MNEIGSRILRKIIENENHYIYSSGNILRNIKLEKMISEVSKVDNWSAVIKTELYGFISKPGSPSFTI